MAFLEIQLATDQSFGAQGGPTWSTDVVTINSGFEQRNQVWSSSRRKWDLAYVRNQTQLDSLIAFFNAVRGRANGFRLQDPADYSATVSNGLLGTGVGTGLPTYQLIKRYNSGGNITDRTIAKPVSGTITAYRNASAVTFGSSAGNIALDTTTGIVTFVPDALNSSSAITPGTTTQVTIASNLGLTAGQLLYLSGFSGADSALINGIAHTINSISGTGPYVFTLATNTNGKTITVGSGSGAKYPQASDALTWAGQFDTPVRFDTDELSYMTVESSATARYYSLNSLPVIEIRV